MPQCVHYPGPGERGAAVGAVRAGRARGQRAHAQGQGHHAAPGATDRASGFIIKCSKICLL